MSPDAKPVRKDVARNRALLLASAKVVFAEQGLDATLDDIAKHAGVGTGTAYRHFANKQEIAAEVLGQASESMTQDALDALAIDDPWLGITTFFETIMGRAAVNRGLHESLAIPRASHEVLVRQQLVDSVTTLFARAKAAGVIRADADPTDAGVILSMLVPVFDMAAVTSPDLWRRYLWLLLDGLRATDEPALPVTAMPVESIGAALSATKRRR
ncbi:MAG: TetR family transcriptional regulator [Rhodoglobus sp.]|nr:TetR family transcriptional regulator [Rhodoglobus sp.]